MGELIASLRGGQRRRLTVSAKITLIDALERAAREDARLHQTMLREGVVPAACAALASRRTAKLEKALDIRAAQLLLVLLAGPEETSVRAAIVDADTQLDVTRSLLNMLASSRESGWEPAADLILASSSRGGARARGAGT